MTNIIKKYYDFRFIVQNINIIRKKKKDLIKKNTW